MKKDRDARKLRDLLESIAFAGMQATPSDPLYLSSRTTWQKVRRVLLIVVPCVLAVGLFSWSMFWKENKNRVIRGQIPAMETAPPPEASPAAQAVEVSEARLDHSGAPKLVGNIRNKSDSPALDIEINFELTNTIGTYLGATTANFSLIKPHATQHFEIPVTQEDATIALVRTITGRVEMTPAPAK
jgi:hypothetical protein